MENSNDHIIDINDNNDNHYIIDINNSDNENELMLNLIETFILRFNIVFYDKN